MKSALSLFILAGTLALPATVLAQNAMLRIACDGEDVGAEVSVNGKFRGECPFDVQVPPGVIKLRVAKTVDAGRERVMEQEFRMSEGTVKKVPVQLGAARFTAEGQKREDERLAAEAVRREQELWQQAEAGNNAPALSVYLARYPNSRNVEVAREMLAVLLVRQEQALWQKAKEAPIDKGAAVQAYLDQYPNGRFAQDADEALAKMVSVTAFGAAKPGEKEIVCGIFGGLGNLGTPDGKPFSEFIRQAFLDELKIANIYAARATASLSGNLDTIDFSYSSGEWNLALTVKSSNGKSVSMAENYSVTTSLFSDKFSKVLCDRAGKAFAPAVKSLVDKVMKSPEFLALIAQ